MKTKTVKDSKIEMRMLIMPNDTNPIQTVFGGVVMSWIDMAASMVASKHSERAAVTVHISDISFKAPMKVGDHCLIFSSLNYVGTTSMLIGVKVYAENPVTSHVHHTTTAYAVFVAVDDQLSPVEVPPLQPETDDEKRRYEEGKQRMASIKKT